MKAPPSSHGVRISSDTGCSDQGVIFPCAVVLFLNVVSKVNAVSGYDKLSFQFQEMPTLNTSQGNTYYFSTNQNYLSELKI